MYLVFDIGGTKMRLGVSKDLVKLEQVEEVFTPQNFEKAMHSFSESLSKLLKDGQILEYVVGCVPGPLNEEKSVIIKSPNLPEWNNQPILERIKEITKSRVVIENDAALAALGEAKRGAGKGCRTVVYYTVSTGIGGCRVVDGKIDVSRYGFEPGQQIFDAGGSLYPEAKIKGNLEAYASGKAVENRFKQKPHDILDEKIWDEVAHWFAYGVYNGILHWSPDIIVCGGSMILKTPGISLSAVEKYVKEINSIFESTPKITEALLGQDAGLYGGLELIKDKLA